VAENRAVTRSRSRRAQQDARSVRARAETAQDAARRATDLAVSALAELDGLRRAMQSRSDIDLAKGILMERLRTDAGSAFDMLVKMSQRSRTKLVDVARAIVADVAASPVRDTD
jgi:AmiR/NasT family two-component response regulator